MYENNVNTEGIRRTGSAVGICSILRQNPHATAVVRGSSEYPEISGRVKFYQMRSGVLVAAEIFGLPMGGNPARPMPGNIPQPMPDMYQQPVPRSAQQPLSENTPQPMPRNPRLSIPRNIQQSMPGNMAQQPVPGNMARPMPGESQQSMPGNLQQPMPGNTQQSMPGYTSQAMSSNACASPIFGFHIHSGSRCSGNMEDPFAEALEHYNPNSCMHPYHAGDMPPLFGNNGYAYQIFLTDRFTVNEIIGKTVIIHSGPDDFITQPGGNAGKRIACGQILGRETRR